MTGERRSTDRASRQARCPLPGGCTALAGGALTGEYGRCWCAGDDQVRISRIDLLIPVLAALLALVATLLTGFFVLQYADTDPDHADVAYHFWGWPREWRTDMPQEAMARRQEADLNRDRLTLYHGRDSLGVEVDWQESGFERGGLSWDWLIWFLMILPSCVALRILWALSRIAYRRIAVARLVSRQRQA